MSIYALQDGRRDIAPAELENFLKNADLDHGNGDGIAQYKVDFDVSDLQRAMMGKQLLPESQKFLWDNFGIRQEANTKTFYTTGNSSLWMNVRRFIEKVPPYGPAPTQTNSLQKHLLQTILDRLLQSASIPYTPALVQEGGIGSPMSTMASVGISEVAIQALTTGQKNVFYDYIKTYDPTRDHTNIEVNSLFIEEFNAVMVTGSEDKKTEYIQIAAWLLSHELAHTLVDNPREVQTANEKRIEACAEKQPHEKMACVMEHSNRIHSMGVDKLALIIMAGAGYNPQVALSSMKRKLNSWSAKYGFEERLQDAQQRINKMQIALTKMAPRISN